MPRDEDELRSLWQQQPVKENHVMSVELLVQRESAFLRLVRLRNAFEYAGGALVILASVLGAVFAPHWVASQFHGWHVPNWPIRLELVLVAASYAIVLYLLRKNGTPLAGPPRTVTLPVHLAHYRSELARQRDLMQRVYVWYGAPLVLPYLFPFVYAAALMHAHHGLFVHAPGGSITNLDLLVLGLVLTLPVFPLYFQFWRRAAKRVQKKIDALDP
jgi:hypothetical protein